MTLVLELSGLDTGVRGRSVVGSPGSQPANRSNAVREISVPRWNAVQASGLSVGNKMTSRSDAAPSNIASRRSTPNPKPPAGGMP